MVSGAFKFVFANVIFFIIGIVLNPALAALFNGFRLPGIGVFLCQLLGAGLVVASK